MIIKKEFKKIADPRWMYAFVKINACIGKEFEFSSIVQWPSSKDSEAYEKCICDGIKEAIIEFGISQPVGKYVLEEIKASEAINESAPIAYYFAAKEAMVDFLHANK